MNITNENTLRSALTDGINLFFGSGFSVLARNASDQPMPVGNELTIELGEEFGVTNADHLSLSQICTIIRSTRSLDLDEFLRRRFRITDYDERYENLEKLNIRAIFTTNIDNLIFRIFQNSRRRFVNDITIRGPAHSDREAIDFVPLHGSVVHESGDFIFSAKEIATAFASDPDMWYFLTRRIQESPTLFWGYRLSSRFVNLEVVRERPGG
jgi:SIR2-like protein